MLTRGKQRHAHSQSVSLKGDASVTVNKAYGNESNGSFLPIAIQDTQSQIDSKKDRMGSLQHSRAKSLGHVPSTHYQAHTYSKSSTLACSSLVRSLSQIYERHEIRGGSILDNHALLLSSDSAFIFPYSSTHAGQPPVLTFPLPKGEIHLLGILVSNLPGQPGLLVIMPTSGQIGFWPAVRSALSSPSSSGLESKLQLQSGEEVTHLCNAGAAGAVASTSSGKLIHLSLRDTSGKACINVSVMSPSGGWLGVLRASTSRRDIVSIKAGNAKSRDEREIVVATKKGGLYIWEVSRAGNYRSLLDTDLSHLIQSNGATHIIDMVTLINAPSSILLLVTGTSGTKLLGVQFDSSALPSVTHAIPLPSIKGSASLYLPEPGVAAFIHNNQSIHIVTINTSSVETILFKDGTDISAVGTEDALKNRRNAGLVFLTKGAGAMRLEVFPASLIRPNRAKTRLEQAVFYGFLEYNPISFDPPPQNADEQVRELSNEILKGKSPYLSASLNLSDSLGERVVAATRLAQYINSVVSIRTSYIIRTNAEKLAAGESLWKSIDCHLESGSLLSSLVPLSSTDPIRIFFQTGLDTVEAVVSKGHQASMMAAAALDSLPLSKVIIEANEIILAILIGATRYREQLANVHVAGGDYWTSESHILESITVQFDITRTLVSGLKDGEESEALRDQLVGYAGLLCLLYEERMSCLVNREMHAAMQTKYQLLRSDWLKRLVEIGRVDRAFEIAERYKDFQSLVEICHNQGETASDEETLNKVVSRLEWYMHTFKYPFAQVLWEYYISRRQFWNLLHQFPSYREYLTQFFEDGRYPHIAWMNDVILKDYKNAGQTLMKVQEPRIEKRKIQLSIAKLSLLVNDPHVSEEIDEQLEVMEIMQTCATRVKTICPGHSSDTAALKETLLATYPSPLASTAYGKFLSTYIAKLLRSEILTTGQAIDHLTLSTHKDFFGALRVLVNSHDTPPAVYTLLEKMVWRRCFVADE